MNAAGDIISTLSARVSDLTKRVAVLQVELESASKRLAVYEEHDNSIQDALSTALKSAYQIRERAEITADQILEQAREERRMLLSEITRLRDERDQLQEEIAAQRRSSISAVQSRPLSSDNAAAELRAVASEALKGLFQEIVDEIRTTERPARAPEPPRREEPREEPRREEPRYEEPRPVEMPRREMPRAAEAPRASEAPRAERLATEPPTYEAMKRIRRARVTEEEDLPSPPAPAARAPVEEAETVAPARVEAVEAPAPTPSAELEQADFVQTSQAIEALLDFESVAVEAPAEPETVEESETFETTETAEVAEPEPIAKAEPAAEPEPVAEAEPASEVQAEPEPEAPAEAAPEPVAEVAPPPAPEPVAPEPVATVEPAPAPAQPSRLPLPPTFADEGPVAAPAPEPPRRVLPPSFADAAAEARPAAPPPPPPQPAPRTMPKTFAVESEHLDPRLQALRPALEQAPPRHPLEQAPRPPLEVIRAPVEIRETHPPRVEAAAPTSDIQLVLSPVASFPRLVEIERRIQSLPVVRTLYVRDFRAGAATLAVTLRSAMTPEEFASILSSLQQPRMRLVAGARNTLELRIEGEAGVA